MNGRTRAYAFRIALLGIAAALAGCATALPPQQQMSIIDVIDGRRSSLGPASCAALNAAAVCEKSTRLDRGHNCGCADPQRITDGTAFKL